MSTLTPVVPTAVFAARIGLDWADKKHFWSMLTAEGKRTHGALDHTPEAIEVWVAELTQRFGGRPIAIALEQSRGALVAVLSKYANVYLFPIHPNNLAHYRDSIYPSGAKSDPADAGLILDYFVKHPEHLRQLEPDTVETRTLQLLTEQRRDLVHQRVSEIQMLTHWLKAVFPQIVAWFDVSTPLVGDLLKRWPSLLQLQKAQPKTVRKFLYDHNCRSETLVQQRLDAIATAIPATTDAALLKSANLRIRTSVLLLAHLRDAIAELDSELAALNQAHPDHFIVASLPGAGPALEPRIIAALGTQRNRFASANDMACAFGIAPVTVASGNSRWVHWRWACPKFIRQTFHEWAGCSIRTCAWAKEHYDRQRDNGKGHHAAIRSVAFKWIRIVFRCWKDRVPYSEERYLAARAKAQPKLPPTPAKPSKASTQTQPTPLWKNCGGFSKFTGLSS